MTSRFFRLNYLTQADLDHLLASQGLAGLAPELGMLLRPGHVIVAARFDSGSNTGQVRALGRVVSNGSRLTIDWRPTRFDVHPGPQGAQHWQKNHFGFAPAVALRYRLAERAETLFEGNISATPAPQGDPHAGAEDDPGYIYVIRSKYGFKIGKTRHLHGRTKLFAVKLPFPISVELSGWCRQYSATERALHREFAGKRLDGEWFALTDTDLAVLRMRFSRSTPPQ